MWENAGKAVLEQARRVAWKKQQACKRTEKRESPVRPVEISRFVLG